MRIPDDPNLVKLAIEGNTGAIEQLLLRYQPSITRFARKYCATPDDVEDAVQETLWVIYRRIGSLRSTTAFVSWAFQIVRHQCYLLLHRWKNHYTAFEVSRLDDLNFYDSPEQAAALKQDIIQAIAHLPADYRQVLILRDIEGYSGPEVAEQLGLTVETVKARLHRGRRLLREMLSQWQ
jgi:RNA polymerase sigma-70 factor (ECF subfamily)